MSFENSAGLNVRNSYGPRTTNNKFGGKLPGDGGIKQLEYVFSYDDLPAASLLEMEHLMGDNALIVDANFEVIVGFAGGTSYDIDVVDTAGGAIGTGEDKLWDLLAVADINVAGERSVSSTHGGTNSGNALNVQLVSPAQLQVVATGTFTAGKARILIDYIPSKYNS